MWVWLQPATLSTKSHRSSVFSWTTFWVTYWKNYDFFFFWEPFLDGLVGFWTARVSVQSWHWAGTCNVDDVPWLAALAARSHSEVPWWCNDVLTPVVGITSSNCTLKLVVLVGGRQVSYKMDNGISNRVPERRNVSNYSIKSSLSISFRMTMMRRVRQDVSGCAKLIKRCLQTNVQVYALSQWFVWHYGL